MHPETDIQHMRRALRLAMNGRGRVEPNPMVGCVIVKNGRVIGEGYHQQFGGPHAEPNALAACTESPEGATAYVTLEPCCHTGKKTPPCVPVLIEAKVGRVVIGCLDPNPPVNGRGIEALRSAGITVAGPILEDESKQLIASYIAKTRLHRPYVTLKWAESADGFVAAPGGKPLRISNETSTRLVHQLRSRHVSIAVGLRTVLSDDPLLTPRDVPAERGITRVILDPHLRLPLDSRIVQTAGQVETIVYHGDTAPPSDAARLAERNVIPIGLPLDANAWLSLPHMLADLGRLPMLDLLVEPGPTLARAFIDADIVDRIWLFRSPVRINESTAPVAASIPGHYVRSGLVDVAGDVLTEFLNPHSEVYFAPCPSADFVLGSEVFGAV